MSVLIKGIAMPKESWDCPCHDGETGWCKVTKSSCEPIPKDCPLVEVPTPQGELMSDLINRQDAIDALEEQLDYLQMLDKDENPKAESKWYGVNWARNTIADLPSAKLPIKEKCCVCPHCDNCDVNEGGADMRGYKE